MKKNCIIFNCFDTCTFDFNVFVCKLSINAISSNRVGVIVQTTDGEILAMNVNVNRYNNVSPFDFREIQPARLIMVFDIPFNVDFEFKLTKKKLREVILEKLKKVQIGATELDAVRSAFELYVDTLTDDNEEKKFSSDDIF